MDKNSPQYHLKDTASIENIQRDDKNMLQSFDIKVPPSNKQPEGSTLKFDLSKYARDHESAESNHALRESLLKASQFSAENIPSFTTFAASLAESGAQKFSLQNPDASRFVIAKFPGITTNEKKDVNNPIILVGNLDRLTEFSQIGFEEHPKSYIDSNNNKQDLKPVITLLNGLAIASKDLQTWPLPLSYDGRNFGRQETISNVMKASAFVRDSIKFNEDDTPSLDDLRQGGIPSQLQNKGYPEPLLVISARTNESSRNANDRSESTISVLPDHLTMRDRIAANLLVHFNSDANNTNDLAV